MHAVSSDARVVWIASRLGPWILSLLVHIAVVMAMTLIRQTSFSKTSQHNFPRIGFTSMLVHELELNADMIVAERPADQASSLIHISATPLVAPPVVVEHPAVDPMPPPASRPMRAAMDAQLRAALSRTRPGGNAGADPSNSGLTAVATAKNGSSHATKAGVSRAGLGHTTTTSVFGLSGTGSKFVYVFDRSGSMANEHGCPLEAAKRQLIQSLADLAETHQFQIVFYNEQPRVVEMVGRTPRLMWGNATNKQAAALFVQGIDAIGATRHWDALRLALGMRPDVIFFLTDADEPQLTDEQLARLRRLNGGTVIHTIEFGNGPTGRRDNFLTRLARENEGQHAYVDVQLLSDEL
jgi:hypothetical protein